MKNPASSGRIRKQAAEPASDLVAALSQKVVGQTAAMNSIAPYVQMYNADLAPEGRPIGVFLLLGPTGTGKTKTVEALAEVLHGTEKSVLKVDCGEFQMEHEVAKLIGAPPGYLGHRETQPMLTQQKLNSITSEKSSLSIVLFDEIEKAAPSMARLLLGILDKAVLRLGDNSSVNFEKSLIFLTSNLGAREMMKAIHPEFGFQAGLPEERPELRGKLEGIALAAVRKKFSPEFVNRIDAAITYQPLDAASLASILDQHIQELQKHINSRLGARCFTIDVPPESRRFLLRKGTSAEYGARELKRTVHRHFTQPLAALVAGGQIEPGARVRPELSEDGENLVIRTVESEEAKASQPPTILIVDDNQELLRFLERLMAQAGWKTLTAGSAQQALETASRQIPNAALLGHVLPDGNGAELGVELRQNASQLLVILMTEAQFPSQEDSISRQCDFPVLRKPFLASEVMNLVRARLGRAGPAYVEAAH